MTSEEYRREQKGFREGVRAGREAVWNELRLEAVAQIKDEMYKLRPADEKWDLDASHFLPWDDEKEEVVRWP